MPIAIRFLLLAVLLLGCDRKDPSASETPQPDSPADPTTIAYVGSRQCISCHQQEFQSWLNSHHDLAMKEANESTVLGNFNNTEFDYYGTTSSFYRKDGKYFVRTDGADGELHGYPIAYTFGVYPLQQYLVQFPGGRLQALGIAWDSRPLSEGGQRWFHLYPKERSTHGDPLHWTGINQNWNFMCADCHSTNLQKNYDFDSQSYDTTWSEINVACEACHGPGSRHLQWARGSLPQITSKGFPVSFAGRKRSSWVMNANTGIAHLDSPGNIQAEIETCAQCHSRRATSFPDAKPGDNLLDHFNTMQTDRSMARFTSTAPSCRARCIRPV